MYGSIEHILCVIMTEEVAVGSHVGRVMTNESHLSRFSDAVGEGGRAFW
jgi:hypothetical protein